MTSIRCRLGYHQWRQMPTIEHRPNEWTISYSNARCDRCGREEWFNHYAIRRPV